MKGIPSRQMVQHLRASYPPGTRVRLINMDDPYNKTLRPGDEGTVVYVDDIGTIDVQWDNGSTLGVVYGVDHIAKI